jgi:hypothetical protein
MKGRNVFRNSVILMVVSLAVALIMAFVVMTLPSHGAASAAALAVIAGIVGFAAGAYRLM